MIVVRIFKVVLIALISVVVFLVAVWLWPSQPLPAGVEADKIVVLKGERRLVLLKNGKPLKSYRVALGGNPEGRKVRQDDGRTPEGSYRIDFRKADSAFHRALHISYPDTADRARARNLGVSPGGAIMIHGMKNGFGWIGNLHWFVDWTDGCIAVTDGEIEEIWRAVPNGTPVEIRP